MNKQVSSRQSGGMDGLRRVFGMSARSQPIPVQSSPTSVTTARRKAGARPVKRSDAQRKPSDRRTDLTIAGLVLAAVILSETVITYVTVQNHPIGAVVGVGIDIVLLTILLLAGSEASGNRRAFLLTCAVAPMIRVISLSMPLGQVPQAFWYLLTAVPVFAGGGLIAKNIGLSWKDLNLVPPNPQNLPLEIAVACSGVILGVGEWSILGVQPMVSPSWLWIIGGALILMIFTGLFEEFIFRGLIQTVSTRWLGTGLGVAFTALIFAALHIGWHNPLDLLFVLVVAVYFSAVVLRTKSLFGVTLAHGSINIMLFIVLPLLLIPAVQVPAGAQIPRPGIRYMTWGPTVPISWNGSGLASRYQLQIVAARRKDPNRAVWRHPLVSRVQRADHYVLQNVKGGRFYFWRVRSLAPLKLWAPYSRRTGLYVGPHLQSPTGLHIALGPQKGASRLVFLCWHRSMSHAVYDARIGTFTGTRQTHLHRFKPAKGSCVRANLPAGHYRWEVAVTVKSLLFFRGPFSNSVDLTLVHRGSRIVLPAQPHNQGRSHSRH